MIQSVSGVSAPATSTRNLSAFAAIFLGILLFAATGFLQPAALHAGTHDTRHAFALPCH